MAYVNSESQWINGVLPAHSLWSLDKCSWSLAAYPVWHSGPCWAGLQVWGHLEPGWPSDSKPAGDWGVMRAPLMLFLRWAEFCPRVGFHTLGGSSVPANFLGKVKVVVWKATGAGWKRSVCFVLAGGRDVGTLVIFTAEEHEAQRMSMACPGPLRAAVEGAQLSHKLWAARRLVTGPGQI